MLTLDEIKLHQTEDCEAPCPFHSPSQHHMADWPMVLRLDRLDKLVERVCEHGCGHPDPDSLGRLTEDLVRGSGIHGCDLCCVVK